MSRGKPTWEVVRASHEGSVDAVLDADGTACPCGPPSLDARPSERRGTPVTPEARAPDPGGSRRRDRGTWCAVRRPSADNRGPGERRGTTEIAVYTMRDGRVVEEERFYGD